ncbi:MAG: BrnT family toxin [Casimicrobiaceae bacterium]
MNGALSEFDWDRGNRAKCQEHGVSLAEIEALFHGAVAVFPHPKHSPVEERLLAIGKGRRGRYVFLAFTIRVRGTQRFIRPISARYMHQKEVEHYARETDSEI